jgi:hypothetical protein
VVESNGQDVRVPWFSGLCLEGEVAGQYEMDLSGSQQESEGRGVAGVLELDGLAPITIFVGANNSGKSRLMRNVFRVQYPLKFKLNTGFGDGLILDIGKKLNLWISKVLQRTPETSHEKSWIINLDLDNINDVLESVEERINDSRSLNHHQRIRDLESVRCDLVKSGIKDGIRGLQQVKRCYIPILRGMRPALDTPSRGQDIAIRNDQYEQRTIHDYFKDIATWPGMRDKDKPRSSIFTGLSLYDNLRKRLLGRTQIERDTVREYEYFLSEHFFPGQGVTLIPVEEGKNDVVHIKIGNNKEYPIYDLGDGLQSLIICTYPIVTETEPGSLFFLEEPDLCMHPSLQRTLLEVLKNYHRKMGHQFFITTHSNHLLDLLEDNELVSIFSFSEIADRALAPTDPSQGDSGPNPQQSKPKPSFRIRPSNLRDRQTLLELGVRPSATFLANATIWVEGVSDCAYLRAYMEAFIHYLKIRGNDWGKRLAQRLEQYKEDRHYAFIEYNGSNLVHFSFESNEYDDGQAEAESGRQISVPDLCATAIVIADGDVREKGSRSTWLEEELKERFICLPGKEIENLIPVTLMKQQIHDDHTRPRKGSVDPDVVDTIAYAEYARSEKGVGAYLGKDKNISKYLNKPGETNDAGTLPSTYKTRWRSELEGIPSLIREAINPKSSPLQPGQIDLARNPANTGETIQASDLPDYFTQDLIWLCVLLYSHIASCNHDTDAEGDLKEFKKFIVRQYPIQDQACQEPVGVLIQSNENPQDSHGSEDLPNSWPIPDPNKDATNRNCLLTAFLCQLSQPESHPEITSATPGPTNHTSSLTP